jgi:hypothetical protein
MLLRRFQHGKHILFQVSELLIVADKGMGVFLSHFSDSVTEKTTLIAPVGKPEEGWGKINLAGKGGDMPGYNLASGCINYSWNMIIFNRQFRLTGRCCAVISDNDKDRIFKPGAVGSIVQYATDGIIGIFNGTTTPGGF